jgi:ABC-type polysaccharide/polyol phosphate export permease
MANEVYDSRISPYGIISSLKIAFLRRSLIQRLLVIDIMTRYRKSVLGVFWSFINPLMIASVIYFVFGRIFNNYMPETRGYASWVLSGVLLQGLLLSGITVTSNSLQTNVQMMAKNRIQPIVFALSSSGSHVVHFLIGTFSLFPLAFVTAQTISLRALLLPLYLLLACLWIAGLGLLLVGWFIRFDDAAYLFNALIMVITYLSPFFYPLNILGDRIRFFVELNPITSWVLTFRWLVYEKQEIESFNIVVVISSSLITFFCGIMWLRRRWNDYIML